MKKKVKVLTIALTSMLVAASISVPVAFALSESSANQNNKPSDSGYGKPPVEDVYYEMEGGSKEPNDLSSSTSDLVSADDEWVKLVEYEDEGISYSYDGSNKRYGVYLPKDFEAASIMNINDSAFVNVNEGLIGNETGNIDWKGSPKTFSTADSVAVNYSYSYTYKLDIKIGVTFSFEFKIPFFHGDQKLSFNLDQSWSHGVSQSYNQTFQAKYYNSNGVAYPWRIVSYNLEMPIKIKEEKKSNKDEWLIINEKYTTISLIQGVCRQWRQDEQFYYEDWNTGNPVLDDDFWAGCYSAKDVISKYKTSTLTPSK